MNPTLPLIARTTGVFNSGTNNYWNRNMKNKYSRCARQKAIDAKCKDCSCDSLAKGYWRYQIENCSCTDCPLYHFRPITFKGYVDVDSDM